jgi:K+-transporting ATPase ATPase A chain
LKFGEVTPGGTGSGLSIILVLAVLSLFRAGLMVGRTPEYLQNKISGRRTEFVALNVLAIPTVLLLGIGLARTQSAFTGNVNNSSPARPSW